MNQAIHPPAVCKKNYKINSSLGNEARIEIFTSRSEAQSG